jgi:hypothetical protein
MTTTTSVFQDLAQRYIEAWNQADPEARRQAVTELFTADARFVDPLVDVRGREAIVATITAVRDQFPGFVFRLAGPVDGHHDQARFTWEFGPDGAEAPIVGFDVAVTDETGLIHTVHGFLDRVPTAA